MAVYLPNVWEKYLVHADSTRIGMKYHFKRRLLLIGCPRKFRQIVKWTLEEVLPNKIFTESLGIQFYKVELKMNEKEYQDFLKNIRSFYTIEIASSFKGIMR
jgi:hypothetical protein